MAEGARIRRLRWLCRRGMKELDVLLASFLDANSEALEAGDWPQLERLLASEDDQLWDALRGAAKPADPSLDPLIKAICSVERPGTRTRDR